MQVCKVSHGVFNGAYRSASGEAIAQIIANGMKPLHIIRQIQMVQSQNAEREQLLNYARGDRAARKPG